MQRHLCLIMVGVLALSGAGFAVADSPESLAEDELEEGYRAARKGYWQEANMRFERANELDPGNIKVLNNLAVSLEAVGRWEDAKTVYEQALALEPDNNKVRKNFRLFSDFYGTYILKDIPNANVPAEMKDDD